MRRIRLAIQGFGAVGRACAAAVAESDDFALAGVVRRHESLSAPPAPSGVPVVPHAADLAGIDAMLICLPAALAGEAAVDLLQHGIPVVEAAALHGPAFRTHRDAIHRAALRHHVPAVVGAGWNPGMLGLLKGLFAAMTPRGSTDVRDRPGVHMHHTLAARSAPGVREAVCAERHDPHGGPVQRYVYVEMAAGADPERAVEAIRSDPLFLDEETTVVPVESIAGLEEEGHGVLLERWGRAGGRAHQRFLLEGRFDVASVTGQVMLAAARALAILPPGAHTLADVPPSALWRGMTGDDP